MLKPQIIELGIRSSILMNSQLPKIVMKPIWSIPEILIWWS